MKSAKRRVKPILIALLILIAPFLLLFLFFNSRPFSEWCGIPEQYIFQHDNPEEIREKITAFYFDNIENNVWDWSPQAEEYKNTFYQSGAFEGYKTWSITYFLPEKQRTVDTTLFVTETECWLQMDWFTVEAEPLDWNGRKIIVRGDKRKILNSLQKSEEKEDVLSDFEKTFLDKLGVAYFRRTPDKENIAFSNAYLFFHPEYAKHYKMTVYEKTYKPR